MKSKMASIRFKLADYFELEAKAQKNGAHCIGLCSTSCSKRQGC